MARDSHHALKDLFQQSNPYFGSSQSSLCRNIGDLLPIALGLLGALGCAPLNPADFLERDFSDVYPPTVQPDGLFYTVCPGDTVWDIAQRQGISADAVLKANDIQDPRVLRIGMRLFLPRAMPDLRDQSGDAGLARLRPAPLDSGTDAGTLKTSSHPSRQVRAARSPRAGAGAVAREGRSASGRGSFTDLCWPVANARVTSRFGKRSGRRHNGVDLAAKQGTAVRAAAPGMVILVKAGHAGYGNMIILSHENGYFTVYAHNRRNLVRKGQRVTRCQQIAELGSTGRTTGPHLHFEVRKGKQARNPLLFLEP